MEITKEDLQNTYQAISDEELINIYSSGTLTDIARNVLEAELKSRNIPIPEQLEAEKQEITTKSKGGVIKKIFLWIFAIIGFLIIKTIVDVSHHPNRQERLNRAVENAVNETKLKNEPAFSVGENKSPPSDFTEYVTAIILQMKMVILNNNDTPASIEEKISKAREMGLTAMHLDRYSYKKIGWSAKDSKGRKVYSIIITFNDNSNSTVEYLAPLLSQDDASTIFGWHHKTMNNHYPLNGPNNYNIGDNCNAHW